MRGLLRQFDASLTLAVGVTAGALVIATSMIVQARSSGRPWLRPVARVLTVGAVVVTIVSTALPRSARFESDGDLVLMPGRGGLGDLDQIIAEPTSLAAVLLVANIVLYAAIAFLAMLGWHDRRRFILPACLGLSVFVEVTQFLLLGRVGATDDVILNVTGAVIGYTAAAAGPARGLPGSPGPTPERR